MCRAQFLIQLVCKSSMCELFSFPHQVSRNSILHSHHIHSSPSIIAWSRLPSAHSPLFLSLSLSLSPFEFMVMIWTVSIVSTLSAYRAFSSHYINSFCSILWILMDVKTNYNKKEMQTESWITFKMVHRNITTGSCCLLKYGLVLSVIST